MGGGMSEPYQSTQVKLCPAVASELSVPCPCPCPCFGAAVSSGEAMMRFVDG